jgi:NhaP-type Na+/H+ or K+/H+ antiporter
MSTDAAATARNETSEQTESVSLPIPSGENGASNAPPVASNDGPPAVSPASPDSPTSPSKKLSFVGRVTNVDAKLKTVDVAALANQVAETERKHEGTAWYDATTISAMDQKTDRDKKLESPTKCLRIGFNSYNYLVINVRGHVTMYDVMYMITKVIQVLLLLGILYFALPVQMSPGGAMFSPIITILFGSIVGTLISKLTGVPQLIGMLLAGILWGALPLNISGGTPMIFVTTVRTIALTAILCRAGINFNWSVMKPVLLNVSLLSFGPQIVEACGHAALAFALFDHPNFVSALMQGFEAAPVSNAIMIPIMSVFRAEGYSVARGPSLLMMVAGATDNVIAVWFINFLLGILFPVANGLSLSMRLILAPVQIICGFILGIVLGFLIVWFINQYHKRSGKYKGIDQELTYRSARTDTMIIVLGFALLNIFLFNQVNLPGTGTVAAATSSAVIAHLWTKQGQGERKNYLNQDLARVWDLGIAPVLFPLVGAAVRLEDILTAWFLPRAFACLGVGLLVKWIAIIVIQSGTGFTFKEKIFFAVGFSSKATVQAATAGRYAALAQDSLKAIPDTTSEAYATMKAQYVAGQQVQWMTVFCLVVCALSSGIALKVTGRKLLIKDADYALQHQHHHHHHQGNGTSAQDATNGNASVASNPSIVEPKPQEKQ